MSALPAVARVAEGHLPMVWRVASVPRRAGYALARIATLVAMLVALAGTMSRAGETLHVATPSALRQALAEAPGGAVIALAPGPYGALRLTPETGWRDRAGGLTLRSVDPARPARFSAMHLDGVSHLALEGLHFALTPDEPRPERDLDRLRPFRIFNSREIAIRGAHFSGARHRYPGAFHVGFAYGIGLHISKVQGVVIEDSLFEILWRGVLFDGSSDIVLRANEIRAIRSDGFNFAAVQRVTIEDNHFHSFESRPDSPDHRDMIQFWTENTSTPSTEIVIRDNLLDSAGGVWTQSIFLRNEKVDKGQAGEEMFYKNIRIEDNRIHNAHLHGIFLGETRGLSVRNNTLVHNLDSLDLGEVSEPGIQIAPRSADVEITGNIALSLPKKSGQGWRVEGNLVLQSRDPGAPLHQRHVFVDPAGALASEAALQILPSGPGAGLGAALSRYEPAPARLTALVRAEPEPGGAPDTWSFDARLSAGPKGPVPDTAEALWDLGDGTQAQGLRLRHRYAEPGRYRIRLTLRHGGQEARAETVVEVDADPAIEPPGTAQP
ncbi:MAG: right-handed parallel beta-helix repeat-containing protein [Pseudomonadota bacterium]